MKRNRVSKKCGTSLNSTTYTKSSIRNRLEKKEEKIFEEIMTVNVSNLMKIYKSEKLNEIQVE